MLSHEEIIDYTLGGQAVSSACYLISALFLSGNSYSGFNAMLTGFLYAGSAGPCSFTVSLVFIIV